jgi:hypothetical protein
MLARFIATLSFIICFIQLSEILFIKHNVAINLTSVGQDSSVGMATRYGLDIPRIESSWWGSFPYLSRPAWGPPSLLYNVYQVSFPGVKRLGRGIDHPPPLSVEVKERVELYIYSLCGLL